VSGEQALAVCTANDQVRPLVDALEAAGIVVQSIAPAILLAAQELVRRQSRLQQSAMLIWGEDAQVNLVSLENGRAVAWSLAPAEPIHFKMQVDLALMNAPASAALAACEISAAVASTLREAGHELAVISATSEAAVVQIASDIISGAITPWIEFRRGAMAAQDSLRAIRRPLNAALAAAAILCLILAGGLIYRAIAYDHLARNDERALADEFKAEFPGMPVPVNPQLTLESEKRKRVLSSVSSLPPEAQESALRLMRDVLAKLPPGPKLTIDKMTFNPTSLQLEGKAPAHEDVDVLVNAARAAGMDVPLPQMRKDASGRWNYLIQGSKPARAPVAEAK
jgi:hypothetical protein